MLFPNTHKNHMLPRRCIQLPCMNIEVITASQRRVLPTVTAVVAQLTRSVPGLRTDPVISPGIGAVLRTESP